MSWVGDSKIQSVSADLPWELQTSTMVDGPSMLVQAMSCSLNWMNVFAIQGIHKLTSSAFSSEQSTAQVVKGASEWIHWLRLSSSNPYNCQPIEAGIELDEASLFSWKK